MANANSEFDADAFRTGIRFVYNLAAPPVAEEQITFFYNSQLIYNTPVDGEDTPFDPQATVQRVAPRAVKNVPCGIEYFDAAHQEIVFGTVTASKIHVTLLDEDYQRVKGANYVVLGGEKYLYKVTEAPSGLFDVGLYVTHWTNENDT